MEVDKIYCTEGRNDALLASVLGQRGNDPMAMAAMMNGGMNGAWNNPFAYLIWMMFAGRFFNQEGSAQNIEMQNQLAAIRSQLQDNQNSNLIMDAVKGNAVAIGQLANRVGCDFNALQSAICGVQSAIDKVGGQVGFSAERVINAVQNGDCNVIQAIKDCCCKTQKSILEMGYQNQLQNCHQTNTVMNGINNLNTGMERGFANIGYETQKQTCDIIQANNLNTQRIIDTMNKHWSDELQQKYNDARLELSQLKQNETLIAALKTTA